MAVHKWKDIRRKKRSPEALERIDKRVKAELDEMARREALGLPPAIPADVDSEDVDDK